MAVFDQPILQRFHLSLQLSDGLQKHWYLFDLLSQQMEFVFFGHAFTLSDLDRVGKSLGDLISYAGKTIEVWQVYDTEVQIIESDNKKFQTDQIHLERELLHKQIEANLGWTHVQGALIVYAEKSLVAQPVYLLSQSRWQLTSLTLKKDLRVLGDEALQFLQATTQAQSEGGLSPGRPPGVLYADVSIIKSHNKNICAAIFINLSPDDYLVWSDPDKPVSVPGPALRKVS